MSNEYRVWLEDRKEEAWETIIKIAELFDNDEIDDFDRFDKIKEMLERGNWI